MRLSPNTTRAVPIQRLTVVVKLKRLRRGDAALLIWRHRQNIRRLMAGTESRLFEKKASPPPDPSAASR